MLSLLLRHQQQKTTTGLSFITVIFPSAVYLCHCVIGRQAPDWRRTACEVDYGDKLRLTRRISKQCNRVDYRTVFGHSVQRIVEWGGAAYQLSPSWYWSMIWNRQVSPVPFEGTGAGEAVESPNRRKSRKQIFGPTDFQLSAIGENLSGPLSKALHLLPYPFVF